MKKQTIKLAKTTEEALALAAEEFGVEVSDLEYTVLEEAKKGLFGIGAQQAKVEVTYAPDALALALDFVKKLVENMQIEAEISVVDTELGGKKINIVGDAAGVLIGHHGDTLDSLQHLVNLAANRSESKKKYSKISVDVEGYRAKREDTLRALARRMAARVVKYKKSVMLEPMNPYERRIIHSELQSFNGVSTNSIGSENNRKVVIYLDDGSNQ